MAPELTITQFRKVGERLRSGTTSSTDLLTLYNELSKYDAARSQAQAITLSAATGHLPERSIDVTGRTKTTTTIVEKLRRNPRMTLPTMRDIAGIRLVSDMTLSEQSALASAILNRWPSEREPKRIDRRSEPMYGYRALHIEVWLSGRPVEVQLRTDMQQMWADLSERRADTWGRQIRYGEPPDPAPDGSIAARTNFLASLHRLSDRIQEFELSEDKMRTHMRVVRSQDATAEIARLQRTRTKESLRRQTQLRGLSVAVERATDDLEEALLDRQMEMLRSILGVMEQAALTA
jgi:ppGpp synthetase/RelA/SpoT-type nucleotidyltranferase